MSEPADEESASHFFDGRAKVSHVRRIGVWNPGHEATGVDTKHIGGATPAVALERANHGVLTGHAGQATAEAISGRWFRMIKRLQQLAIGDIEEMCGAGIFGACIVAARQASLRFGARSGSVRAAPWHRQSG